MGKKLKVVEYELTFGSSARIVNVFGVFRYKKNNSLYVIYGDVSSDYAVINYGSAHLKNNSVLCMSCRDEDVEIIKEFVFKTVEKEELSDFEVISLDNINGIEIISSKHLELKPDVISSLVNITIPVKEEVKKSSSKIGKKRGGFKVLIVLFLLGVIGGLGYYYFTTMPRGEVVTKTITCSKTSSVRNLNASLEEENLYLFDVNDLLNSVESTKMYHFNSKEDYENFIYNGMMYKYMPEDNVNGGFKKDDESSTFIVIVKEEVDEGYRKPTSYEEVLSYYTKDGYSCNEKLLGE